MTPPPPAELKRVTVRRLLALGLVVLALTALVSALSGIDFAAVAQEVADATWILVLLALVVGQLILIPEALATSSLVPERLPFGPLVALQSAMRFLGLAVPGPAARVAANVAFLRKQGIVVSRSLTLGVLDTTAGFVVEAAILVVAVLVGDLSLSLSCSESTRGGQLGRDHRRAARRQSQSRPSCCASFSRSGIA